jgi:hypothetical protein
MEYFVKSGGHGTDDDLAQIILKAVCNFDYKKRGQIKSFATSPPKEPVIKPYFSGFRMLATYQEARLNNSITLQKISDKGSFMQDYFVMQNRRTFSFDYQRKVVEWSYFADPRLFMTWAGGNPGMTNNNSVASISDTEKLLEAVKRSGKYMSGELHEQVMGLLTPESLAMMAGFGALFIASQVTPVGWVADACVAVLAIGTVFIIGTEIVAVGELLKKFYETATHASSDAHYDEAGKYFAEAVSKIGVDVLAAILFHKAGKSVGKKIIKLKEPKSGGGGGKSGGSSDTIGSKTGTEFEKPVEEVQPKEEVIKTPRTAKITGDPPFEAGKGHDVPEFERQIKGQEEGMNKLTVDEFIKNRDAYLKDGRSAEGSKAQEKFRTNARIQKIDEFRKQGMSIKNAEAMADNYMSDKAALHSPDQIAGGKGDNITGMGDVRVNSSIGSQWKTRIGKIDANVRNQAKTMTEAQRKATFLNVHLYP